MLLGVWILWSFSKELFFLVGVNVLLAEFYPVESFSKNFVRAGSEQPLHQDISVTLFRYMSAEYLEWSMRTFYSHFSNTDDFQLCEFWELFSSQLSHPSAPDMECPCTHPIGSQQRRSGALGQIFGALVLHSYPLFGSLCHHSSQPPHILRILISASSAWWSCCVFLGIHLSAPWPGMCSQAESQHDPGAHLIGFPPLRHPSCTACYSRPKNSGFINFFLVF